MSGNGQGVRLADGEETTTIKVGLPESVLVRLQAYAEAQGLSRSRAALRILSESLPPPLN